MLSLMSPEIYFTIDSYSEILRILPHLHKRRYKFKIFNNFKEKITWSILKKIVLTGKLFASILEATVSQEMGLSKHKKIPSVFAF